MTTKASAKNKIITINIGAFLLCVFMIAVIHLTMDSVGYLIYTIFVLYFLFCTYTMMIPHIIGIIVLFKLIKDSTDRIAVFFAFLWLFILIPLSVLVYVQYFSENVPFY